MIYPQIKSNPSTIYSFLLMTGYLKVLNTALSFNGDFLPEAAMKQITDKKYDTEMKNAGIQTIYKYGVAFSGKTVEVAVE